MGLDVYVGPLTRYHRGDWLTIAQQVGREAGIDVRIVRAGPEPDDPADASQVLDAVREWQSGLGGALGCAADWPEDSGLPYWTDKPDWDGFGSVMLLAAYDEQPALRPSAGPGVVEGHGHTDDPREFHRSAAFVAASDGPVRYPTLLLGVEWWLPLATSPSRVFEVPRPTGEPARMGSVGGLLGELRLLAERTGVFADTDRDAVLRAGPPSSSESLEITGRYGLAVMLALAECASAYNQPLLLDY